MTLAPPFDCPLHTHRLIQLTKMLPTLNFLPVDSGSLASQQKHPHLFSALPYFSNSTPSSPVNVSGLFLTPEVTNNGPFLGKKARSSPTRCVHISTEWLNIRGIILHRCFFYAQKGNFRVENQWINQKRKAFFIYERQAKQMTKSRTKWYIELYRKCGSPEKLFTSRWSH